MWAGDPAAHGTMRPIIGVMAMRGALFSALLASACAVGPQPPPAVHAAPSATRSPALATAGDATATLPANPDEALIHAFVSFARSPGPGTLAAIPFAEQVGLGLADRLLVERRSTELERPGSWVLDVVECCFRGGIGPFSALELLKRASAVTVSVGPHMHCVSPPVPPPPEVNALRRISVQPKQGPGESCLQWWTVDVFLSPDGRVEAVTLDHYEP
jgi:hypothetical protein